MPTIQTVKRKPGRPVTTGKKKAICPACGITFQFKFSENQVCCSRKCSYMVPRQTGPRPKPVLDRIMENIAIDPITGCWIWTQELRGNYSRMAVGRRKSRSAHVVSYEAVHGKVPAGLELDHRCRRPACVNPDHLEAVTHRVNLHRCPESPIAINVSKTHCIRGHEFTPDNTYLRPQRSFTEGAKMDRECRKCLRIRKRKCRLKAKAKSLGGHSVANLTSSSDH